LLFCTCIIYSISCCSSYSKNSISTRTNRTIRTKCAATGKAFTVTVEVADNGREQVPLLTLVRFKVVLAVAVTVTLTVPPAPIVAVPDAAPVWFTVFPAVPVIVKVTSAGRGLLRTLDVAYCRR
jgi:hypothetical protein